MGTLYYRHPTTGEWTALAGTGPAGADGPNEVAVQDTVPTNPSIELWVDRDNDLGNSGWDALDGRYVNAAGDTMSGALTVNAAVQINGVLTMGNQRIAGLATASAGTDAMSQNASDTRYLAKSGGTMTGPIAMGSQKITGLATPTAATDAATMGYVDGRVVVSSTAPASPTVGQLWATP